MRLATWRFRREPQLLRRFSLLVSLVWTVASRILQTPPLMFYLDGPPSFTDAYFETVSGITTTGASVLADLDKLPPSIQNFMALSTGLAGRHGIDRALAVSNSAKLPGRGRHAALQGRNAGGPDEGNEAHPRVLPGPQRGCGRISRRYHNRLHLCAFRLRRYDLV